MNQVVVNCIVCRDYQEFPILDNASAEDEKDIIIKLRV